MKLNLWESICDDDDLRAEYEAMAAKIRRAAALVAALDRHHPYHDDLHPDVVAALNAYLKAAP